MALRQWGTEGDLHYAVDPTVQCIVESTIEPTVQYTVQHTVWTMWEPCHTVALRT